MDDALRLGLICQKVKTKPPMQVQKYCGFLYDTCGSPEFWVPPEKQSCALAMIGYLRVEVSSLDISRLTLAVVMGLLQFLVEATLDQVRQTYLQHLYDAIHELGMEPHLRQTGRVKYHTRVALSDAQWDNLSWWELALQGYLTV